MTPGPWEYDGKFTVGIPAEEGVYYFRTNQEDAAVIAMLPEILTSFDDMLAILNGEITGHHQKEGVILEAKMLLRKIGRV